MTTFNAAILEHFEDYIAANCPKLTCFYGGYWPMYLRSHCGKYRGNICITDKIFRVWCDFMLPHVSNPHGVLDVPLAAPDSLEQIELFLREFHNRLP